MMDSMLQTAATAPTPDLDALDRALVQALMIDGRVPFSRLAEILGVTDQTVTRRYRRLRTAGLLRVIGLPVGTRIGLYESRLRIQCTPGAAVAIADALARRRDIAWVTINAGGTEVTCMSRSRTREDRDALLLQKLPRTQQVTGVAAQSILHTYIGGPGGWRGVDELSAEQISALTRPEPELDQPVSLDAADFAMLAVLARDGRAAYGELAAAADRSESTARRRLEQLRDHGAVYFDVEIMTALLGYHAEAALSATVPPSKLAAVGEALSRHPEVPFAAATTGTSNLIAAVVCRDLNALYAYITERIGQIKAVTQLEVVPVLRTVKRAGLLTDGLRLVDPPDEDY